MELLWTYGGIDGFPGPRRLSLFPLKVSRLKLLGWKNLLIKRGAVGVQD